MKVLCKILIGIGIMLFFLSQLLLRINTSLLMSDLDEVIKDISTRNLSTPKEVHLLVETSKEYGVYQGLYDQSIYYIIGSGIILILYIIYLVKKYLEKVADEELS